MDALGSAAPLHEGHAYIDEAGQRSNTRWSSKHFVMAAVIVPNEDLDTVANHQALLRADINRQPGDALHWQNMKSHSHRLHAAKSLAQMPLTVTAVVVGKDHLSGNLPDEDHAYLYTLRFLLERLSWWARDNKTCLSYTLSHVKRFKVAKLREYEQRLRDRWDCSISWPWLDPSGGRIDRPKQVEQLQLADIAASAIFKAFEPDEYGNTEQRYLQEFSDRLYRRPPGPLTSYGLKIHPGEAKAAYPWVAAL